MWEEKLKIYQQLVQTNPELTMKGKIAPCTTANGYMFSQLNKEGQIGIRLPKEVGEKFKKEYNSTEFRSYGAVMKDYVLIPEKLFGNLELLGDYLNQAYEYVMNLEPKTGKK